MARIFKYPQKSPRHRIYLRHRISEYPKQDAPDQHPQCQGFVVAGFHHEQAADDAADNKKVVRNDVLQSAKDSKCGDGAE